MYCFWILSNKLDLNPETSVYYNEYPFAGGRSDKYAGLEELDVGSKFRMFERKSASPERPEHRGPASDRFGIMEKLKRLQVRIGTTFWT